PSQAALLDEFFLPPLTRTSSGSQSSSLLSVDENEQQDDSEFEYDLNSVDTASALMCILARLQDDTTRSRVNKSNIPATLTYLLSIDLREETFSHLLSLLEGFAQDFYSSQYCTDE